MGKYTFYTFLYIDDEYKSLSINGVKGDFEKQIITFIRCAENLHRSLKFFADSELFVLTNNSSFIRQKSRILNCIEIPFHFDIPQGIKFFAAFHKIDAFKWFYENRSSEYSLLLDTDILCINPIPQNLKNCIVNNIPVYYDITNQVFPAYGRKVIISDKNKIMNIHSSIGLWAGGEFLGGPGAFFKQMYNNIQQMSKVYFSSYKNYHHEGNETLFSSGIEFLLRNKIYHHEGN
ncbi:MAG TPA: hypothetical protein VET23_01075, partial [Chitinophagaceae bacterium]|nr:hypothetical protein [Chitinophagaceae bacterium]